jgi:hypothetical protein
MPAVRETCPPADHRRANAPIPTAWNRVAPPVVRSRNLLAHRHHASRSPGLAALPHARRTGGGAGDRAVSNQRRQHGSRRGGGHRRRGQRGDRLSDDAASGDERDISRHAHRVDRGGARPNRSWSRDVEIVGSGLRSCVARRQCRHGVVEHDRKRRRLTDIGAGHGDRLRAVGTTGAAGEPRAALARLPERLRRCGIDDRQCLLRALATRRPS